MQGCRWRCIRGCPASRSAASGATPQPRIPFERGQCATATSCSARSAISSSSDFDAVRGEDVRAEETRLGERADARRPERRHEQLGERLPAARPVRRNSVSAVALGEVGREREPELGARPVELDRARVGGMWRDPDPDVLGEASAMRSRIGSNRSAIGASVAPKTSR